MKFDEGDKKEVEDIIKNGVMRGMAMWVLLYALSKIIQYAIFGSI